MGHAPCEPRGGDDDNDLVNPRRGAAPGMWAQVRDRRNRGGMTATGARLPLARSARRGYLPSTPGGLGLGFVGFFEIGHGNGVPIANIRESRHSLPR